jgi:hypothetical protein
MSVVWIVVVASPIGEFLHELGRGIPDVHRHFVEGVRFDRLESLGRRRSGGNQLAAVRSLREMAEQQERRRVREDEERTRL